MAKHGDSDGNGNGEASVRSRVLHGHAEGELDGEGHLGHDTGIQEPLDLFARGTADSAKTDHHGH
jgi:hypothetical protein